MKISKLITILMIFLVFAGSCKKEINNVDNLDSVTAPTNLTVAFDITQDNSGLVTIIPNCDGVTEYMITFGDSIPNLPSKYGLNETITHVYSEGVFTVGLTAVGLSGLTASIEEDVTVSFIPPENLEVTVANDVAVSLQVNISAIADYATLMEFYFGEVSGETPIQSAPGETVLYHYSATGDYEITVVAMSGATQTLDSTFMFTVTEISGPQGAAPTPPGRVDSDVLSIYSGAYTNLPNTNFNPNWGQTTIVTFEAVDGDSLMVYGNFNYQGIELGNSIDATEMEYLHLDIWTIDATEINVYLISPGPAETPSALNITPGEWVSYDIPLSDFSSVVDLSDIFQLKFDGTIGSSFYMDNIYIYRDGASTEPSLPLDFESSTITYEWVDFDGGVTTVIDNTQVSGINTSSKVAHMVKNPGATWGGSWIGLDSPIDFSTNKTFKMKVFSPRVGAKVLLKVENKDNAAISFENEQETTVANTWEEITFDYNSVPTSEDYHNIVIIFDNGTQGDGSPDFTFLFDDIELTN